MTHTPYRLLNAAVPPQGITLARSCARWVAVPVTPGRIPASLLKQTPPGLNVPARYAQAANTEIIWSTDAPTSEPAARTISTRTAAPRTPAPRHHPTRRALARATRHARSTALTSSCARLIPRLGT